MVILRVALAGTLFLALGCTDSGGPGTAAGEGAGAGSGPEEQPASVVPDTAPPAGGDPTLEAGIDPVPAGPTVSAPGGVTPPLQSPAQAVSPPAAAETAPAAEAILLRAERAYDAARSLRAGFVQDLSVPLLASTQRSRGQIFHRKPDRFLMRFSDPAGDIVVADGQHLWLYYPSSDPKQVIRTSVGQAGRLDLQREFLSNPTERYAATLHGTETVGGRSAHALTLVPRAASPYRQVKIWIDARDFLARRFEITESNDAVRRVELQNLEVNVPLPDSLFAFTPPAGAQVFDQ